MKYALFLLTTLKTKDTYMLPYFEYTEDIQNFCQFMGYTIELPTQTDGYVCMYSLEYLPTPLITSYNLDHAINPLIPPNKVIDYLTLMLNGYSYEKAVNELNVIG